MSVGNNINNSGSEKMAEARPFVIKHTRHRDDILAGLQKSFRSGENCDLRLLCQGRVLHCHRSVLGTQSETFAKLLTTESSYIPILGTDYDIISHLLELIYFGQTNIHPERVKIVCRAAVELGFTSVIKGIQEYSKTQKSNLNLNESSKVDEIAIDDEGPPKRHNYPSNDDVEELVRKRPRTELSLTSKYDKRDEARKEDKEIMINPESTKNMELDEVKKIMKESCERKKEEKEKEEKRRTEERRKEAEANRKIADEKRQAEERRIEDEKRKSEDKKKADEKRVLDEQKRKAEEKRLEDQRRKEEEKKKAEDLLVKKESDELRRKSVVNDENGTEVNKCKNCQRPYKPGHSHYKIKNWSPDVRICDQMNCNKQFKFMRALIDHYSLQHKIDPCYTN